MPEVKRCECCGAVVFEAQIFKPGTVKAKMLQIIRDNACISGPDLKKQVFSHNAQDNLLSVHIHGMNKTLKQHGLKILGRPHHGYRLIIIEAEPCIRAT